MGRTHTNQHDIGDIDDDFFADIEDDNIPADIALGEPNLPRAKRNGSGKKAKKLSQRLKEELDDWQDPEDDLMYGFED